MSKNEEIIITPPTKHRKVIFSFTSYANDVISALKSSIAVHVTAGLTPTEITSVESAAGVAFPADLRSILAEGLPVGPGFPNWLSSSRHQLRLLTTLPILSLVKEVSRRNFWWAPMWGPRPDDDEAAVAVAREFLASVPRLVPVFRHCYIPCEPSISGNPVFYVHGGDVRLLSDDVAEFYKTTPFWRNNSTFRPEAKPPTTTTSTRKIEFWSDVAEHGGLTRPTWWTGGELGDCLESVARRLRDGGWGEDDVREMMMMDEDGDDGGGGGGGHMRDREGVERHVRRMWKELVRSGWSVDDVVYSLGEQIKGDVDNWVDIYSHCGHQNSLVLSR
ncbi:hypothetical protein RND81_02G144100 [Saponaria officinalis]|uniref:Uncharacterized protein n=1 Tax=Saponaria officinalis TaxID=3572 RepID=A0AAW1MU67_SAPOF